MPKALLLIISGAPCTGKTTLGRKIAEEFCLPLISRDDIKESLFDSLGVKNREWSKKLGIASYKILYKLVDLLLRANQSFILESNFKPEADDSMFLSLQRKYDFNVLQLICKADNKILYERFKKRSESGERHPGHVDNQNYNEFKDILLKNEHKALNVKSKILNINTTDFKKINYSLIFDTIKSLT